jgi:hypothetical protein
MGADRIDTPPPSADSPLSGSDKPLIGPDASPLRDEGTPATDLDLRPIRDIEPVHRAPESQASGDAASDIPAAPLPSDAPSDESIDRANALALVDFQKDLDRARANGDIAFEQATLENMGNVQVTDTIRADPQGYLDSLDHPGAAESEPVSHEADWPAAETTPDDHRREGAAAYARAEAAYREADRIIDRDHKQGWAARAEDSIVEAGEELAAGQREDARANQAERFGLENENRNLLAQARELERDGDEEGARALLNEADAKMAAAYERLDRALDHLSKAQDHESQLVDSWMGKSLSNLFEETATIVENLPDAVGPVKDVAAVGLRTTGHMLEVYGLEGLRDVLGDLAREVRAKRL